MAMFIAVLLAVALVGAQGSKSQGPTFDELRELLEALERSVEEGVAEMVGVRTQCALNEERGQILLDRTSPFIEGNDPTQDSKIDDLSDQIKAMVHRVDHLKAKATRTLSTTTEIVAATSLINQALVMMNATNEGQQARIVELSNGAFVIKGQFLDDLEETAMDARRDLFTQINRTLDLAHTVVDRKCVYGQTEMTPGVHDIQFETSFTSIPEVSVHVAGFLFDMSKDSYGHGQGYGGYDHDISYLTYDKFVVTNATTTDGFTVSLEGEDEGDVHLIRVLCSWAACQGI